MTPRILANPLHGTVRIDSATNQAVYTPAVDFFGTDTFSYINTDANGTDSNVALVSFNVAFLNHPPVANGDSATTSATTPITIQVSANNTDPDNGDTLNPASVSIVSSPASGTAAVNPDGSITFTPAAVGSASACAVSYRRVTGTATIPGPENTITLHIGPTLAGPVLGTVAVDGTGGWDFVLNGSSIDRTAQTH